jgi:hypothetical protein
MTEKYADLLTVDRPIAGQEFVVMSFCSPEKILKQKELYFFEQFVKTWDFTKSMEKFIQFVNFVSFKYKIPIEKLTVDFEEFVSEEKKTLTGSSVEDDYKNFLDNKEEEMQKQFDKDHNFRTNVRAVKCGGTFPTYEEAEFRAKVLGEQDNSVDIFVGPVGTWLIMHPDPDKTSNSAFYNDELNRLFHEKKKNQEKAKQEFDARVREAKRKAIQDNIEKASINGAKLTQNIDEDGNLYSCNQTELSSFLGDGREITKTELCKKLFEGDDIITGDTDHGKSRLMSGPFVTKKG